VESKELIVKLRSMTGAGIMDCKNALKETGGDIEKAVRILREKGIAKSARKATRPTNEGVITSYIHPGGRVGVLLELNCETDFVARTDEFKNLAKELCLQIAAMSPRWVKKEDIPESELEKEKEIYRKQFEGSGKPEHIIEKIVEGKLKDFYKNFCLYEQPWIKDEKKKVEELVKEVIAKTGENIRVHRFVRFELGEE